MLFIQTGEVLKMINTKPFCYYGFTLHQEEDYCFYDWETGSLNPKTTQPLELAAVMIDSRKLTIIKDSLFYAKIKPLSDDEAIKKGLEPIQKSALAKNNIKLEDHADSPDEKTVWEDFVEYQYRYNKKKDTWNAAIPAGFNIDNYDKYIVDRMCEWYGPWDKKREQQKIFNPIQSVDLKNITFLFNENNPTVPANNFDAIRAWLNLATAGAHTAKVDVMQGAEVFCKMLKCIRYWAAKTDFSGVS